MAESKGYIRTSDEKGSINIGQNVVATIAAAAAVDVDGVYGLYQHPDKELTDAGGKRGIVKDARITIEEESITADMSLIVKAGYSVSDVAANVQKAVKAAIEEATGVKVTMVNVNVCGISMRKQQTGAVKVHGKTKPPAVSS